MKSQFGRWKGVVALVGLAMGLWLSVAACTDPAQELEERRPVWDQKLAKLQALAGKIASLDPQDKGSPPAAPLELRLATINRVSNGTILDLRQLDPAWKAERIEYRYPFQSYELGTCRRLIAPLDSTKPMDDDQAKRFVQGLREYERWLLGLKYVVVAREDEYQEPSLKGGRFSPGLIRTSAFLFRVDDATLLGRYELTATITKDVIRTVYTKTKNQEDVIRQNLHKKAKDELLQVLAQQHQVWDWLGTQVRKR